MDAGERPKQDQPAAEPDEDQIEQTDGHGRTSCPTTDPGPSLQLTGQADFWHPTSYFPALSLAGLELGARIGMRGELLGGLILIGVGVAISTGVI